MCKQNIGITISFGVAFLAAYLVITEYRSKPAEIRSVVALRRKGKGIRATLPKGEDVETAAVTAANSVEDLDLRGDDAKAEKSLATAEQMTNTFSWEGLNYTVPIHDGEERKLLSDVSGYVVPEKLITLMGESGAGKVRVSSYPLIHRPN